MDLKPQDVVVVLKLVIMGSQPWTYAKISEELSVSASQVYRSVDRAEVALLLRAASLSPPPPGTSKRETVHSILAIASNVKEFLIYGVKYAFPVHRGGLVRGMPTAHAAAPLDRQISSSDPPPVWPTPDGWQRGTEFSPLSKNVPQAARRDQKLYELLALVDAIRDGRARERDIAVQELTKRIDGQ